MEKSPGSSDSRKRKLEQAAKPVWRALMSSLGRIYFFDTKKEISQWDRPVDFDNEPEYQRLKESNRRRQAEELRRLRTGQPPLLPPANYRPARIPPHAQPPLPFSGRHVDLTLRQIFNSEFDGRVPQQRTWEFVADQNRIQMEYDEKERREDQMRNGKKDTDTEEEEVEKNGKSEGKEPGSAPGRASDTRKEPRSAPEASKTPRKEPGRALGAPGAVETGKASGRAPGRAPGPSGEQLAKSNEQKELKSAPGPS